MDKFNPGEFIYVYLNGEHMYLRLTRDLEYNEKYILCIYYDKMFGLSIVPKINGEEAKMDKVIYDVTSHLGTGEGCLMIPFSKVPVTLSHLDTKSELYASLIANSIKSTIPEAQ